MRRAVFFVAVLVMLVGSGEAKADPGDLLLTLDDVGVADSVAAVGSNVLVGDYQRGAAQLWDGVTGELLRSFHGTQSDDRFGFAVAEVGGNVLVGAPYFNGDAVDSGAAYLFDSTTGQLLHTFLNPEPENRYFGFSVAAAGDDVLVSTIGNVGAVHLFDGLSGNLLRTYRKPTPSNYDAFGCVVTALAWIPIGPVPPNRFA